MPGAVVGPPYKPTRHNRRFATNWEWLRQHCVYVLPFWERGGTRLYNVAGNRRIHVTAAQTQAFGANDDWRDMQYGPGIHLADAGYIDTNQTRVGGVGLFCGTGERFTAVVRCRTSDQATDGALVARGTGNSATRTFMLHMNRPGNAASTPRLDIRGAVTNTGWNLDDGQWHTYFVTWDGTTALAWYDQARGRTVLTVGTAAEETGERILLGARTVGGPSTKLTGDLDFFAILDIALGPAAILQWQRDLLAPWRPQRRVTTTTTPAGPPAAQAERLVFATRPLDFERLELWTDVQLNGGARIAPILHPLSAVMREGLNGEHTVRFAVPMNHPVVRLRDTPVDLPNLRVDQVVRVLYTDGSFSEHRIAEVSRQNQQGHRTREIVARSIVEDLSFRGMISRTDGLGKSSLTFEALGLTMAQHLESFVLPALEEAGQTFWAAGTMTHAHPCDMVYEGDVPLSALRKLAVVGGDLELAAERRQSDYAIHLLKQVGAGLPPIVARARRNLVELGFTERAQSQVTRIYAVGQDTDGIRPNVGQAIWHSGTVTAVGTQAFDIQLLDPAGGEGAIVVDGQFLPLGTENLGDLAQFLVEDFRYHLTYLTGAPWTAPIIGSFVSGQRVRVESLVAPPAGTHRVKIVRDADQRELLYVEHPTLVQRSVDGGYGVRTATLERPDIPATDNWEPNPYGRLWPADSPLPTGWVRTLDADNIVTRETNPKYWEHGGWAIRNLWKGPGVGTPGTGKITYPLVPPIVRVPFAASGYISFFVRVTTLAGKVQIQCVIERSPVDQNGNPTPSLPWEFGTGYVYNIPENTGEFGAGDLVLPYITNIQLNTAEDIGIAAAWDLSKFPLYGGTVTLRIFPARDAPEGTECIVEAVQVTNTPDQMPLLEGNGGVKLHQAANERLGRYATPEPSVTVSALDLGLEGRPIVGAPIQIIDPDAEVAVSTRLVGIDRNLFRYREPSYELSNQRADLTRLLTQRPRPDRHRVTLVPPGTRGLTYEPS